jgi:intergrase/recombinase
VLESGDASAIASLSPWNKYHAMHALANYAKYTGRYDRFLQIKHSYNLKWTSGNESLQSFERFFNPDLSLDSMLQRVREMIAKTPLQIAQIIKFACLTGLRPSEVVESVRLLNSELSTGRQYYNPQRQALEHFRFPDIFLRQTKKAYISFVSPEILDVIKSLTSKRLPTYNAIRLAIYKRGIKCDMRYCRKLFASHLIKSGIDSTTVDMLQGRVGKSVLVRHYQTPDSTLADRVLQALHELKREID